MVINGTENALSILANKTNSKQKLWSYMTENMVHGNKIVLAQTRASIEIGISRQQMGLNLKSMLSLELIVFVEKNQSNNVYMLNPSKVWKGDAKYRESAEVEFAGYLRGRNE